MKGKTIVNIRCQIGIYQFAGQQALDRKRFEDCTMEMTQVGVLVKAKFGLHYRQVLVPFGNIIGIEMEDEKQ